MQRGGGGAGHPGGIGARAGVAYLLLQHRRHHIRHGPHALADLGMALQAANQADIDIPVLIGLDPGRAAHVVLADHRARFHRGMDLIARAVEEAGIDEGHPVAGGADAVLEVHRGPALLIHDAHLQRVAGEVQRILHPGEELIGPGHFLRPVHFRLHDIDAAMARIAHRLHIMQGDGHGAHGVQNGLGRLGAVKLHRIRHHVVAHIAHQHHRTAMQGQAAAGGGGINAVGIEPARHDLAALLEAGFERAIHQAEPVAIDLHLIRGIDGGDAVLAILNGGQRRFQHQIGHAGQILVADGVAAVDHDLGMQAIMLEQDGGWRLGRAGEAHELAGVLQAQAATRQRHRKRAMAHLIGMRIGMAATGQRRNLIQHLTGIGDDGGATLHIIARLALARDGVGAIERVIEAAPARIGGVEREAGIGGWHHQLRPRGLGDLIIDIGGIDGEILALGQ